jgi:CubicO group peptidase (beta-lactamase class C family)
VQVGKKWEGPPTSALLPDIARELSLGNIRIVCLRVSTGLIPIATGEQAMRRLLMTVVTLATTAASMACGQAGTVPPVPSAATMDLRPNIDGFSKEVKSTADLLHLPGYSVAVVEDGKIIYRLNSGSADIENHIPVTDETLFSLASVTKSFTAVMLMQYEEEKKISLDDYLLNYPLDVSKYVPSTIDVNTKLKHVLSMTSGDLPGTTFAYNGWRYSFLSGVFEQVTQLKSTDAYKREVESRILDPLQLRDTFDGIPDNSTAFTNRIAKGYYLQPSSQGIAYKATPYDADNYYPGPAAGLFSTINDLATYTTALDNNSLISRSKYVEMTSPYVNGQGKAMPYGFGWMTQAFRGLNLHWVYGEGRLDSALLLRVPERHLSLIMLANSADPSSATRLHDGNILRSPIALAFLKYFVLPSEIRGTFVDYDADISTIKKELLEEKNKSNPLKFDEVISQAECRYYAANLLHAKTTKPQELLRLLYEIHPQSFDTGDVALMWLMARIDTPDLHEAVERLIRSFDTDTDHRPEVLYSIGAYYEMTGDRENSMKYYKLLADRPGFRDEWYKIDASHKLGRDYLVLGNEQLGRKYIWQSALESRGAGFDSGYLHDLIRELKQP